MNNNRATALEQIAAYLATGEHFTALNSVAVKAQKLFSLHGVRFKPAYTAT